MNITIDPQFPALLNASLELAASQNLAEDRTGRTQALSIVSVVLAVVFIALRFLARSGQGSGYALDDWLMLVALFVLGGVFAGVILSTDHGLGKHWGALTPVDAELVSKFLILAEMSYVVDVTVIKISILSMYYRLFPVRSLKIGAWVLGAVTSLWTILLLFIIGFQCIPFEKFWRPWVVGRCIDFRQLILGMAIPNILSDVAILALPLPQIWGLQISCRQKAFLSGVFLLGSLVVATSIYRFIEVSRMDMRDFPYTAAPGCIWSLIELSCGVISACLPNFAPLARETITRFRGPEKICLDNENPRFNVLAFAFTPALAKTDTHELDGQRQFHIPSSRPKTKDWDEAVEEQKIRVIRLVRY
ncbi:hypothetical protein BKA61DRAFT_716476 [Leptodontidium sp. MPI-SDFR-AT-0119]|nr:hypothetical protein BKA61DRAFT_716476 [Leptodontidium sp. MPI-SDFR-AT-0119]